MLAKESSSSFLTRFECFPSFAHSSTTPTALTVFGVGGQFWTELAVPSHSLDSLSLSPLFSRRQPNIHLQFYIHFFLMKVWSKCWGFPQENNKNKCHEICVKATHFRDDDSFSKSFSISIFLTNVYSNWCRELLRRHSSERTTTTKKWEWGFEQVVINNSRNNRDLRSRSLPQVP